VADIGAFLEAILAVAVGISGIGTAIGGLINAGPGGGTPQALVGFAIYLAVWAYALARLSTRGAAQPAAVSVQGGVAKQT
jgi:hypothetical protein